MTATLPWPAEVTDFRSVMVEKFLLKVVTDTVAPPEEPPEVVVVVDDELLLPQAAANKPPASNRGTRARLLVIRMVFPHSDRLDRPIRDGIRSDTAVRRQVSPCVAYVRHPPGSDGGTNRRLRLNRSAYLVASICSRSRHLRGPDERKSQPVAHHVVLTLRYRPGPVPRWLPSVAGCGRTRPHEPTPRTPQDARPICLTEVHG